MRTLSTCALVSCCSLLLRCSRSSRQIRSPFASLTRLASSPGLLALARQARSEVHMSFGSTEKAGAVLPFPISTES